MPRPRTFNADDEAWVRSQKGSNSHIHKLSQRRGTGKELSEGIIKRIRRSVHAEISAPVAPESLEIEDEIIVQRPLDSDPDTISGANALMQPQTSILPVIDRQLTASLEDIVDQGSAIAMSSVGKRKRLAMSSDTASYPPSRGNPVTEPQIVDSDSDPDVTDATAERKRHAGAKSRLRRCDRLNSTDVNGLVELLGGVNVQTYHSDHFRSRRQIELAKFARVNGIPLNINDKNWAAVVMDGATGSFKYYNPLSPQWTEEIIEAMTELSSRVINVDLKSPEEVGCAKQLNEYDGDIHTILNLTYLMLGIPVPKYIDSPWWRSILSWIWYCQNNTNCRLSNESASDDAVDCEDNSLLTQSLLQNFPTAKSLFKEQLIGARRAVRQGLNHWSASWKHNKQGAAQLKRLQKAQDEWQAKIRATSEELETIEKLTKIAEELGHNKHLVNVGDCKEKAECLRENLISTKESAQESEEQLVQLVGDMTARKNELISLRGNVGEHIARLDMVTGAILELKQNAIAKNPQLATFNRLSGPSSNDRLRHDAAQDTQDAEFRSLSPGQQRQLNDVVTALKKTKTIIALVGAGISTSVGIPAFRSKDGFFNTLKKKYNIKGSGKDLFHVSVYQTQENTAAFHDMVRDLSIKIQGAEPTQFHRMLGILAAEGRLLRLISQNIDGLDTAIPSLATKVPLTPPYPTTLQLHGSIEWMTCTSCHRIDKLDPKLFYGSSPSPCVACTTNRKRATKVGGMRPRFTLYEERGHDDDALNEVLESDLKKQYKMCIVAGTALKGIPSVRNLVCDISSRVDLMVWINQDPPPKLKDVTWHLIFQGLCDDVAREFMAS